MNYVSLKHIEKVSETLAYIYKRISLSRCLQISFIITLERYVFIPRNVRMNYYQLSSTVHINLMSLACNNSLCKNIRIVYFCQIVSKVFHPRIVQTCPGQTLVHSMEPYDLRSKRCVIWLLSLSCI